MQGTDPGDARTGRDIVVPLTTAVLAQPVVGVGVCDADGLLVEQNPALTELLGTPDRAVGSSYLAAHFHLHTEDGSRLLEPHETPLRRALRGETVRDEVVAVRKPGQPRRYIRCNGTQIHHRDGTLAGAVVFVVDVTAGVQQRHEIDALRDRLIDTVNHELRTPAAGLVGHIELLDDLSGHLPAHARWSVEALVRNLARMQSALDQISDMVHAATARS